MESGDEMNNKRSLIALLIILISLFASPMALVKVDMEISLIRILTLAKWAIVTIILFWFIKPTEKEIKCATVTGIVAFIADFIGEWIGIATGKWGYQGGPYLWGVPVDIPLNFFLVAFIFCLGYSLFEDSRYRCPARMVYILSWGIALAVIGYLVNIWASQAGFVLIDKQVNYDRPIYLIFFVIFGFSLTGLFTFIYHLSFKMLKSEK